VPGFPPSLKLAPSPRLWRTGRFTLFIFRRGLARIYHCIFIYNIYNFCSRNGKFLYNKSESVFSVLYSTPEAYKTVLSLFGPEDKAGKSLILRQLGEKSSKRQFKKDLGIIAA